VKIVKCGVSAVCAWICYRYGWFSKKVHFLKSWGPGSPDTVIQKAQEHREKSEKMTGNEKGVEKEATYEDNTEGCR
jgi:hypothetical protein